METEPHNFEERTIPRKVLTVIGGCLATIVLYLLVALAFFVVLSIAYRVTTGEQLGAASKTIDTVTTTTTTTTTTTSAGPTMTFGPPPTSRYASNQYGCHSDGRCLDKYDRWCDKGDLVYFEITGEEVCEASWDDAWEHAREFAEDEGIPFP